MTTVRRRFALAALLAILVVATAAAGLDGAGADGSGEIASSTESGVGFGSNTGIGSGNGTEVGLSSQGGPGGSPVPTFVIEHALSIVMILSVTFPIVYAAVLLWQEGLRAFLEYVETGLKRLVMAAVALLGLIAAFILLSQFIGDGGGGLGGSNQSPGVFVGEAPGGATVSLTEFPIALLIAGVLAAIVGYVVLSDRAGAASSVAAALTGGAREARAVIQDTDRNVVPSRHRFDDVEPTNEVYRAWLGLARSVEAIDEAHTPKEVAARAVDRGLDDDAVTELTDVFREVRYSSHQPTAERERQARNAAERIDPDEDVRSADSDA